MAKRQRHDASVRAAQVSPLDEMMANRAVQLAAAGRLDEAESLLRQFIGNNPKVAFGHYNLGNVLRDRGRNKDAAECFRQAGRLAPDFAPAFVNQGNALQELGQLREALAAYERALAIDPAAAAAAAHAVRLRETFCEWDGLAEREARVMELARHSHAVPPFTLLAMESSPEDQMVAARNWGARFARAVTAPAPSWTPEAGRPLRLGYASTDFRQHAVAQLVVGLIEQHDRTRFQVFGYSFGADDASPLRRRLEAGFDVFVDLRGATDDQAAARIRQDGIDILVDLTGYTLGARTGVFGRRAAPLQVNFLGYPGTLGADYYDAVVVDQTIAPADQQQFYSERLLPLPWSYQPNDNKRAIAEETPSRRECGLPAEGFVFCCFNQSMKIRPPVFDIWMRLLHAVPGSVLWLLDDPGAANLRKEARKRGISPDRLVFAGRVPLERHLARHRHADLFLDTLPYNAHTTASDALWVGVPVLTCLGRTFAARVAGSLVRAAGLPELVTEDLNAYEHLALELARNPARLAELRQRLGGEHERLPLFDTARYTADLEAAYLRLATR